MPIGQPTDILRLNSAFLILQRLRLMIAWYTHVRGRSLIGTCPTEFRLAFTCPAEFFCFRSIQQMGQFYCFNLSLFGQHRGPLHGCESLILLYCHVGSHH